MNKKALLIPSVLAVISALYVMGTPRALVTDLRDAPGAYSSLSDSAGGEKAGQPQPAPASAPQQVGSAYKGDVAFDSNVPANIKAQMLQDLSFVGTLEGKATSPLHQKIYGKVAGADYSKFFNDRVKGVGMNSCGSPNAVACVIPFQSNTKMWLTQNYLKFSHPQIARLMLIFHEARHTEAQNRNWHHADCPDPFKDPQGNDVTSIWTGASLVGEPGACDITPFGSYGSSTIMMKNIQKNCANCTGKVKTDAGIYADDQLNRMVDAKAKADMKADIFKK